MKKEYIKDNIIQAAKAIAGRGEIPTIALISKEVNNTHAYSTIQKYLNSWKKEVFRSVGSEASKNASSTKKLNTLEINAIKEDFEKQLAQNEDLVAQLFDLEEKKLALETKQRILEKTNYDLSMKNQYLEKTRDSVKEEREAMLKKIVSDKDELIEDLRDEIRSLNKAAIEELKTTGFQGDELLMAEKVKNIHLQEKHEALKKQVRDLQFALKKAQETSQPALQTLSKQQAIIQRYVSFEQLQAFEKEPLEILKVTEHGSL